MTAAGGRTVLFGPERFTLDEGAIYTAVLQDLDGGGTRLELSLVHEAGD